MKPSIGNALTPSSSSKVSSSAPKFVHQLKKAPLMTAFVPFALVFISFTFT